MENQLKDLGFLTETEAALKAIDKVDKARKGELSFLKTRNEELNHIVGKGFDIEEGQVILLFSPPNHGKSTKVRMFKDDFTNPDINPDLIKRVLRKDKDGSEVCTYESDLIIIHSMYEGKPYQDILRTISEFEERSYNYLHSAEFNYETNDYNSISDTGFEVIKKHALERVGKPIFYVPFASSPEKVLDKIALVKNTYPKKKIVWLLDHYLLSEYSDYEGKDIGGLVRATARVARLAKSEYNVVSIILGQTNNNILDANRHSKASGHYLIQSDIYFGGEIYQACDTIIGFYQPARFRIPYYGNDRLYTGVLGADYDKEGNFLNFTTSSGYLFSNGLIPNLVLKGRNAPIGEFFEADRLDISTFKVMSKEEFTYRKYLGEINKKSVK